VLFTSSYRDDAGTTQSRLMIAEHMSSAEPLPARAGCSPTTWSTRARRSSR
jgi:hypothetical protein